MTSARQPNASLFRSPARHAAIAAVAAAALLLCNVPSARAQSGTIVDLSENLAAPSSPGYAVTLMLDRVFVTAINDAREVAGWHQFGIEYDDNGQTINTTSNRAFVWREGTVTDLGGLQGDIRQHTMARDINNDGDIVGSSEIFRTDNQGFIDVIPHAFIWSGAMTDLMPAGLPEPVQLAGSGAIGVNNDRHVAGSIGYVAKRWIGPTPTDLGVLPGYYRSFATAVNDSGYVVGASYTANLDYQAFRYRDGQGVTDLSTLIDQDCCADFTQTYANGINQSGTIVGWGKESGGVQAFIWENGVGRRLRFDGYATDGGEALAINNAGQIVGRSGQFRRSTSRAFIWLPLGDGLYQTVDLNEILPANSPWVLLDAIDINENGQVVGHGLLNGQMRPYLLETGFGLTVNSTGDAPDFNDTDGNGIIDGGESGNSVCDTGSTVLLPNGSTAPECTLRAAISETNFKAGPEKILFNVAGQQPFVIAPQTPLPVITDAVSIDGYTQPGSALNTSRGVFNGNPLVELSGRLLPANSSTPGLEIVAAGSEISGLVISGFPGPGVAISGTAATGNHIFGNRIGLRGAAISDLANPAPDSGNGTHGIYVLDASGNLIGGGAPGHRNILSGNRQSGVHIEGLTASSNSVVGNFIGTDSTGVGDAGNGLHGVAIVDAPLNKVGDAQLGLRNVISGNDSTGVFISGVGATDNTVAGNYIGVDVTGGAALGNTADGILLIDAPGNTIGDDAQARNVIAGNLGNGVRITGMAAGGNTIQGNHVGVDSSGTVGVGNGASGIRVDDAPTTTIGGNDFGDGNVISGNADDGVRVAGATATGTIVRRNVIGASTTGDRGIRNIGDGVAVLGASQTVIGGTASGDANFIAANGNAGIAIVGQTATDNRVHGNTIGADSSNGTSRGSLAGVVIDDASGNWIGGENPGESNFIAYQFQDGVRVVSGENNRILRNAIHHNGGLGINLDADGDAATYDHVTVNDQGDADTGANRLQNFPELKIIGAASTDVLGTLHSEASRTYRVEFFGNSVDAEGQRYLGFVDVNTDADGFVEFAYPAGVEADSLTATASDAVGNTSEFSLFPTRFSMADLVIEKSVTPRVTSVGTTVAFRIRVYNNGPHPASNVTVTDVLPAGLTLVDATTLRGTFAAGTGTWTVGDVALSDTLSLSLTARVDNSGPIRNTATVDAGDQVDPEPLNNVGTAVVNGKDADLAVTNVVNPTTASAGDPVTFTITAKNNGPGETHAAKVVAKSPVGVRFTNVVPSLGAYNNATGVWTIGALDSSQTATLVISARADSAGKRALVARISASDTKDPDLTNNAATAIVNDDGRSSAAVLRVVHAIANVVYDTVDVYIDDVVRFNDLVYREAREIVVLAAGDHALAVAPGSSTSVADSIFSDTITLVAGKSQVALLLDDPPADIQMVMVPNVPQATASPFVVDVGFYHAVPDAPKLNLYFFEGGAGEAFPIREDLELGAAQVRYESLPAGQHTFEFRAATAGGSGFVAGDTVAEIVLDLRGLDGRVALVILAGLVDVSPGFESTHGINTILVPSDGSAPGRGSPVGVDEATGTNIPGRLELTPNFPNPFAGTTTIRFALPEPGTVTIEVYDTLGRRVRVVGTEEHLAAGWHERVLDLGVLATGTYVYRLRTDEATVARTMLLVK